MTYIPEGHGEAVVTIDIPGDAGPALTIFGFAYDVATPASTVASDLATALQSPSGIRLFLNANHTLESVLVRCRADAGDPLIAEAAIGQVGMTSGAMPPPQVATLIQKISGRAGRKNRGRMYLPSPAESVLDDDGNYLSGTMTTFQNAADFFMGQLDTAGYPMAILHTSPLDAATAVVSLNVRSKCATQRRRLR